MLRIAREIANEVVAFVHAVMEGETGINMKVNINTLVDSELFKSVQSNADGNIVINLLLNDYIIYVESGRRAGAKMPPFEPIYEWAKRKGLPTDNNTIWAICKAIARDGIAARPVMSTAFQLIDDRWDSDWSDRIFNEIIEELERYFR